MPNLATPLKALVLDDHELVRLGVRHLLGRAADVSECSTLAAARALLASEHFDLLLLDLGLDDAFTLNALPQLRALHPGLKILVLTSMDESLYGERALRAGADGYVMKSALGATLLLAVETTMAGRAYLSPALSNQVLQRLRSPGAATGELQLSGREIEVLRLVAAGKGTREIAGALNRSVKTVETHKQNLKAKLGADSPAQLVRMAVVWCESNT